MFVDDPALDGQLTYSRSLRDISDRCLCVAGPSEVDILHFDDSEFASQMC